MSLKKLSIIALVVFLSLPLLAYIKKRTDLSKVHPDRLGEWVERQREAAAEAADSDFHVGPGGSWSISDGNGGTIRQQGNVVVHESKDGSVSFSNPDGTALNFNPKKGKLYDHQKNADGSEVYRYRTKDGRRVEERRIHGSFTPRGSSVR